MEYHILHNNTYIVAIIQDLTNALFSSSSSMSIIFANTDCIINYNNLDVYVSIYSDTGCIKYNFLPKPSLYEININMIWHFKIGG